MRKIDSVVAGRHGEKEARQAATVRPGAQNGAPVFEDDVMLPDQYFARLRHRADHPGEQRLLLAVLEDAVHCFQTNVSARTPRRRNLFAEAEEWLLEDGVDASVTFGYVCDVFDLDMEYVRAGLRRWRDRQRQRQSAVVELPNRRTAATAKRPPLYDEEAVA
jgi:hypothetical protein